MDLFVAARANPTISRTERHQQRHARVVSQDGPLGSSSDALNHPFCLLSEMGLRTRESPRLPSRPLSRSSVHRMLSDDFYTGIITLNGVKRQAGITLRWRACASPLKWLANLSLSTSNSWLSRLGRTGRCNRRRLTVPQRVPPQRQPRARRRRRDKTAERSRRSLELPRWPRLDQPAPRLWM
jgi:hypothetical protein